MNTDHTTDYDSDGEDLDIVAHNDIEVESVVVVKLGEGVRFSHADLGFDGVEGGFEGGFEE